MLVRHRSAACALAATSILALLAGCGGGGSSSTMSADEVAAKVEAACTDANAFSVWLPEHLAKTHESSHEGEAIVDEAGDRFRSTLESLKASLREKIGLYEEVGAARCGKELQASILVLGGESVEEAFHQEGIGLPPRPAGW